MTISRHPGSRTPVLRGLAVVTTVVLALAACASDGAGESPDDQSAGGGSFVVGLPSFFVQNFTPGGSAGSYVDYALWSPLTQTNVETGALEMMVADSMESDDQKHWTITLKQGWTFHDGTPVTAQSFADSWNTTALSTNALASNYLMNIFEGYDEMNPAKGEPAESLSGVDVVDDETLEVTLNEPNAFLPYIVSSTVFAPMPESGLDDIAAFGTNPVGNGPFMMQEGGFKKTAQDVTLVRYDDYAGEPANVDEVDLRLYQDTGAVFTDFEAGSIDLALLDGSDLSRAKDEFSDQVVDVQFPAVVYLGFPLYDDRFDDPDVRRAISMAIDRESIVTALLAGNGSVATGLAPDTLVGGGEATCDSCSYDPDAAKELLDSAGGWSGPLVLYTYQDPTNEKVLEAVANQLRTNLGIEDVTFEAQEIGQLYERYAAQKVNGPSVLYAGATYPHVYAMADQMFSAGASLNVTGYESSGFADLMAEAASAPDTDQATELAQQATAVALADVPVTPLLWPKGGIVHAENISGVVPEFLGGPHLASVVVE